MRVPTDLQPDNNTPKESSSPYSCRWKKKAGLANQHLQKTINYPQEGRHPDTARRGPVEHSWTPHLENRCRTTHTRRTNRCDNLQQPLLMTGLSNVEVQYPQTEGWSLGLMTLVKNTIPSKVMHQSDLQGNCCETLPLLIHLNEQPVMLVSVHLECGKLNAQVTTSIRGRQLH